MLRTTPTPGVTELARETAMDLGHLVGQHVRVAQLEIAAGLHAMSRRASVIAVLATLIAFGYVLAMAGLAVMFGGRAAVGIPLVAVGLVHLAGGGAGLVLARRRLRSRE